MLELDMLSLLSPCAFRTLVDLLASSAVASVARQSVEKKGPARAQKDIF